MDDSEYYRRQGFWLRMARERAGKSQKGAAVEVGLAESSKSTISDYETGAQVAPQQVLRTLARWYGEPVELFLDPPATANELIDRRVDELERSARDAEREDWAAGRDRGQSNADEPGAEPGTRSA